MKKTKFHRYIDFYNISLEKLKLKLGFFMITIYWLLTQTLIIITT